jgi:TonB family protein
MRALMCLMLMGLLTAQNPYDQGSQYPQPIKNFKLNSYELPYNLEGNVTVEFIISKKGEVINPIVLDTFSIELNETIIDRVKQMVFTPPMQNGIPVQVRYKLPIVFKPH